MIGIFDSGLGGLTAYRELHSLLPNEHFVYFGDTGRVPYGSRSHEILLKYTRQDINFLISKGADAILAACGTVSSVVLDEVKGEYNVPIVGVVDASVNEALGVTKNGIIGVIGTGATVSSGAFEKKLLAGGAKEVVSVACPLFVPLVENGYISRDSEPTKLIARDYLKKIKESGADTLILGCTHFPIIADIIGDELKGVTLINSGAAAAKAVASSIAKRGGAKSEFFVSDSPVNFDAVARIFLGGETVNAEKIDIEKY
ncbi:MAG: glutamate racemase [Clostridia bacterium]|nr:glutamate racemase [Clostridia bacterium]